MEWVSVAERIPSKEGFYQCRCAGFPNPIKCKFRKARDDASELCPDLFIHKGRIPFVFYWRKK